MRTRVQTGPYTHRYEECPDPKEALLTGGIGDVFTVESMTSPEVRANLEGLTLACPMRLEIAQLYQALPNYPKLKKYSVLPTANRVFHSKEELAEKYPQVRPCADWGIMALFPQWKGRCDFQGSSFIAHRLCSARRVGRPYVIIVPHSAWGWWQNRSFDETDWRECLGWLRREGLLGVVLFHGGDRGERVPSDPRLLDLTNQTSILETVELLKAADGYIGIDSALSVLAAQLFPADRLAVKSVNDHCHNWAFLYYAPWTEFPFLTRRLTAPDRR